MKYRSTLPIHFAAWLAACALVGCAPPPSYHGEDKAAEDGPVGAAEALQFEKSTVVAVRQAVAAGKASPSKIADDADARVSAADASDGKWGTLTAKFKFVGTAPEMKQISVTKDGHICGAKKALFDEFLLVGKSGELANVVVYAFNGPDAWQEAISPIHPSFEAKKGTDAVLDNVNCRFEPHVLAGWTEQKFLFRNSDPTIGHNAFGQPFSNRAMNPTIPTGSEYYANFSMAERLPFKVTCSIHPWMGSYVLVRPDPYFAVASADGTFRIENLPARELSFQMWHESLGYLTTLATDENTIDGKKGIHTLSVKPGENDLGELVVDAKNYTKQLNRLK